MLVWDKAVFVGVLCCLIRNAGSPNTDLPIENDLAISNYRLPTNSNAHRFGDVAFMLWVLLYREYSKNWNALQLALLAKP